MFIVDRHANPPILQRRDDLPHKAPDPEVVLRRELFYKALTGDERAKTTLRDTYHLTRWNHKGREILLNSHRPKRSTPHAC